MSADKERMFSPELAWFYFKRKVFQQNGGCPKKG